jgi:nitrogen regulatory protein PII
MKMLMIVFRESIEEDIKALLRTHNVKGFTEMHDVTGTGEAGPAFHSLSWPAFNDMILAALPDAEADTVVNALKDFRDRQVEKQGGAKIPLRVFALPCEMVV